MLFDGPLSLVEGSWNGFSDTPQTPVGPQFPHSRVARVANCPESGQPDRETLRFYLGKSTAEKVGPRDHADTPSDGTAFRADG